MPGNMRNVIKKKDEDMNMTNIIHTLIKVLLF